MDNLPNQNSDNKSFAIKLLGLIGILIGCMVIGNLLLLGLAVLGGMDLSMNLDVFSAVDDPSLKPYIKTGIGVNHLAMFTLSSILFALWIRRDSWKKYFSWGLVDADLLLKFVLLLLVAMPIIGASAMALEGVDLPDWANNMDEDSLDALMKMLNMDGIGDLVVNLLIIAVLPAIGEELLFRGVIQNELIKKMANPHVAIFIASFIFSAFHMQIQGFLPKLIIGLILGYAYYWTKSLWYPIILHFINNGLQTMLLYFAGDQLEMASEEAAKPEFTYLMIGVVISCFLCYLIVKSILNQIFKNNPSNV